MACKPIDKKQLKIDMTDAELSREVEKLLHIRYTKDKNLLILSL